MSYLSAHHSLQHRMQLCRTSTAISRPECFGQRRPHCRSYLKCQAADRASGSWENAVLRSAAAVAASLLLTSPALAVQRLPPIDRDPNRCERAFVGNTIGQANAVSDKILDLRMCKLHGADLSAKVLSGALLSDADLTDTTLRETVLTKAYAVGANFEGADMTNAVVDRVDFRNANLKNVKMHNAVITGILIEGANLEGASFDEALIGGEDAKRLCLNPSLKGESRAEVGCRIK